MTTPRGSYAGSCDGNNTTAIFHATELRMIIAPSHVE
jgi:hypothetical protein